MKLITKSILKKATSQYKLLPIKEARAHIKQPPDHYVKDLIEILKRLNLQPENLKLLPIKEARAHIKQPDHDVNIYVGINKERGIKWN